MLLSSNFSAISSISIIALLIVFAALLLKRLHQPYLIAYIFIGILIGEYGFNLIKNESSLHFMGELGIILLFFFIGMELDLRAFVKNWKLALFGTCGQILVSIAVGCMIGYISGWTWVRSVIIGCIISLSSSAVIFKLLEEKGLTTKKIGENVMSILLAQDVAIAPILIVLSIFGGEDKSPMSIMTTIFGGILIIGVIGYIYYKREIRLPFRKTIKDDHELQVFLALLFCASGALFAGIFGISEALGAFVGGLVMHAGKATHWIHEAIHSFRILFVAVFFISVGAQIDIHFLTANIMELTLGIIAVYLTNHLINTLILKMNNNSWSDAILGGGLLAQVGELSFLICISANHFDILSAYGYNFSICLISLTICLSPFWILGTEKVIKTFISPRSL